MPIAADVHYQRLSRCNRNNRVRTTPVGFGRTRTVSAKSDDLDLCHARWHLEVLRSARVKKRTYGTGSSAQLVRYDGVTGVTGVSAAACKHCRSNAAE